MLLGSLGRRLLRMRQPRMYQERGTGWDGVKIEEWGLGREMEHTGGYIHKHRTGVSTPGWVTVQYAFPCRPASVASVSKEPQ
jgi:hypothetical protein